MGISSSTLKSWRGQMKEFLIRDFDLLVCPTCRAVKKFQEWRQLSEEEMKNILSIIARVTVCYETCPTCKTGGECA